MKKQVLLMLTVIALGAFLIGCPTQASKSGDGSDGGSSDGTATVGSGTGTISGVVGEDAEVTVEQSDGTTQTTTTSPNDPEYEFEDVPEGEATVTVTTNDGETTSQEVEVVDGETTHVNPFGSTQEIDNSLSVIVYEIPVGSTTVSDILLDSPLGDEFFSKEINVPTRAFEEGFPGVTDRFEWFGIVYEGEITAPKTGTYKFSIESDDGAILYINNEVVVNNDGVHAPKTKEGSVDLTAGEKYSFKLKYFQGPKYHISLVVKVQAPDDEMKLFNMNDFE